MESVIWPFGLLVLSAFILLLIPGTAVLCHHWDVVLGQE